MEPKVGIILINYQDYAQKFLADCRDSLRSLNYPKDKYAVYIVDNASTAETQNYLKTEYTEAVVIANEKNSGWGGGNNLGIKQSFQDGCEDVVFLNIDTMVEKDWLKELVEAAYSESPPLKKGETRGFIGIVQSKILLYPAKQGELLKINSLGNEIHFLGFGFCRGYGWPDVPSCHPEQALASEGSRANARTCVRDSSSRIGGTQNDKISDISYASGASMYVKGDLLKQIGLCDEEFFMYHDDLELCLRARLAGWRVVLAPKSVVFHKYQFSRSIQQIYYMERNRLLALFYFYKWPTLFFIFPIFFFFEIGMLFYALKNHWLETKLSVWAYFFNLQNLKKAYQKRKIIQASRKIDDKQMTADFVGKISFQEINNPLLDKIVNPMMDIYWQFVKKIIVW